MEKQCEHCGKEFEAQRSTAKYCSDLCRVTANRQRKADALPRRPLPKTMANKSMDVEAAVTSLYRLSADDRLPKSRDSQGVHTARKNVLNSIGMLEKILARINGELA